MSNRVLVLEFNELTPHLVDRFIAEGQLPNFKRLRDESMVCISDAEEDPPILEPWIQWVTVHTGLSYSQHKIFNLGDAAKLDAPRVWDVLADQGKKSWICGSMNASVAANNKDNVLFLPDPWSTNTKPNPEEKFRPYFEFVRRNVQEYTREKIPLSRSDYVNFVRFMVTNGLSLRTMFETAKQLATERFKNVHWQRAAILDRLQWDVFRHHYKRFKPDLSTFFINSTAHYQHYYWRNMEPESFDLKDDVERQAEYAGAILFGYQKMDRIIGECLAMVDADTTVVLSTALSQQPMTKYDEEGGKQLFKIQDMAAFAVFAGLQTPYEYAPVMAEEFYLHFASEAEAEAAEKKLAQVRLPDGQPVLYMRLEGPSIFAGCRVFSQPPKDLALVSAASNTPRAFSELFYPVDGVKSGMHHPDGILWFRLPSRKHGRIAQKIPLRQIAPTLAGLCGVIKDQAFPTKPVNEVLG